MILKTKNCLNFIRPLVTLLILLVASLSVMAQEDTSQYDKGTPPQHAAGVSAFGSYMSTDLGTVNLGNGSLNFKIPLGQVGGRGFSLPLTLNYSSKIWSASSTIDIQTDPTRREYPASYAIYDDPEAPKDFYQVVGPGWTIGAVPILHARGVGIDSHTNNTNGCVDYTSILVKLTLVLPDKGEIELRDDATDGSPMGALPGPNNCRTMDGNRGTRWHATDGSGTIFINDVANGVVNGNLNGWVITSDGTRYRFNDTDTFFSSSLFIKDYVRASSVTDRNGNQLQISYTSSQVYPFSSTVQFTDQLGRISKVQRNVVDPGDGVTMLAVLVTLPGYDGVTQEPTRYYKIKMGTMNLNYRAGINPVLPVINGDAPGRENDYSWQGPHTSLFPLSYGGQGAAERIDDRAVMTELVLPDTRSLRFKYNEFGEVAEVQMPTGGKVQYDYAYDNGLPSGNSMNVEVNKLVGDVREIDRAVVTRRAYANGTTTESTWTYNYGAQVAPNGVSYGCAEVKAMSGTGTGTVMLNQRHFFLAPQRYINGTSGEGTGYSLWSTGVEWRMETRNGNTVLSASEQDWSQRAAVAWSTVYPQEQPANDNRVNESRNILDDGNVARVTTAYELNVKYNNPVEIAEYDFDGTLKRRRVTSYVTTNAVTGYDYRDDAIHLLSLPQQQAIYDGSVEKARTVYEYDNYTSDTLHAPLQDYASVTGHDPNYGAAKITRGNPTSTGSWLNTTNTYLYNYPRYDVLGNVVSMRDARGFTSSISYADDFGDGSNPGGGASGSTGPTYALPTLITSSAPNAGEQPHTARSQYDFSTGLMTGFKDRNGVISQTIYDDAFNRPTMVKSALGISGVESHARMYYAPATAYGITLTNNDVLTAKDLTTIDDGQLRSWTRTDGFGRTIEGWSKDPQGNVKIETAYDALGRQSKTSNPFRPSVTGNATLDTITQYDLSGRVRSITTPDNAVVTTDYSGNQVLVTDQAGKKRLSRSNALGQLTDVWEITPNDSINYPGIASFSFAGQTLYGYLTHYDYDSLSNLKTVTQGVQTRTFTYNSLKQLTSATNPEIRNAQGAPVAVTYDYDNNGNLRNKTDARSITTHYEYDALNRVISRTYQNDSTGTPAVYYKYDAQSLPTGAPSFDRGSTVGRLVATLYGSQTSTTGSYQGYDAVGRVERSLQVTNDGQANQTYTFPNYDYGLAGQLISETYPSGRTVLTEYDEAGRIAGVKNQGSSIYYGGGAADDPANRIQYSAHGAVKDMRMGNGLWERTTFEPQRLQPQLIKLATNSNQSVEELHYYYGGTDNNGNVLHHTSVVDGVARQQVYDYDALNRLKKANEVNQTGGALHWEQTFIYDRYGNRNFDVANTTPAMRGSNLSVDPISNRYASGQGYILYDNAGNLTKDFDGHTFAYDGENKQTSYDNGQATYSYDGDGKRVKKVAGSATTIFVYDASGQLVAEYSTSSPQGSGGTSYLTADHLGTPRVITDANGAVKSRHDYLPFGEEIAGVGGRTAGQGYVVDSVRQKFTQYERDVETGLDYAQARYYSNVQGRFTSVDPVYVQGEMLNDPQRFNLYSYVRNNPLILIDPTGEAIRLLGNAEERKKTLDAFKNMVGKKAGSYLYENQVEIKDEGGNVVGVDYYVGIYTNGPDGDGQSFQNLNEVAGELAPIIEDQRVVDAGIAQNDQSFKFDDNKTVTIGSLNDGRSPGVTGTINGRLTVFILDPATNPGRLPANYMANVGRNGNWQVSNRRGVVDQGILMGHEMGHARATMTGDIGRDKYGMDRNDKAALRLENKVRYLKNPHAPFRFRE